MGSNITANADAILQGVVSASPRVPGVVAMATDRRGNIFEGAAGKRRMDQDAAMTTDSVFAHIFDHQGDHRNSRAATCRGGQARPRRAGENLCAGHRQDAGDRRIRRRRRAEAARAQARHHDADADAAHRRLRLMISSTRHINRLATEKGQPSIITATKAALMTPLLFDPGERWEYGSQPRLVRAGRSKR